MIEPSTPTRISQLITHNTSHSHTQGVITLYQSRKRDLVVMAMMIGDLRLVILLTSHSAHDLRLRLGYSTHLHSPHE